MKKCKLIIIAMMTIILITACGKFTCDMCGEEKSGISYKANTLIGEMTICSDCYADVKELQETFK